MDLCLLQADNQIEFPFMVQLISTLATEDLFSLDKP